jgi:uncharacterized membrane protein YoaK (UPF0700 family)
MSAPPLPCPRLVLPLLSFGAGAADAFAFTALGGIFTANMTGNAVLATMFGRTGYAAVLTGALIAIGGFFLALLVGFRLTREAGSTSPSLAALRLSAACLMVVAALWWFAPHSAVALGCALAASAAGMALQTVAARRDGLAHSATTTYLTGTLTDLVEDIADGTARWVSWRWLPLVALPLGAASAVSLGMIWPTAPPLLPLAATLLCIVILMRPDGASHPLAPAHVRK